MGSSPKNPRVLDPDVPDASTGPKRMTCWLTRYHRLRALGPGFASQNSSPPRASFQEVSNMRASTFALNALLSASALPAGAQLPPPPPPPNLPAPPAPPVVHTEHHHSAAAV